MVISESLESNSSITSVINEECVFHPKPIKYENSGLLVEQHLAIFGRGPQPEFTKDMLYTTGLEILSSFRKYISFC